MAVSGRWILYVDWDCEGNFIPVDIIFNDNGTVSLLNQPGKWVEVEGMVMFKFNDYAVTYAGNIGAGNILPVIMMTGLMSKFDGSKGCWYAVKQRYPTEAIAKRRPMFDALGNKPK